MHGRLKVRSTEEQKLLKQKEQTKKLAAYRDGMKVIFATRNAQPYNETSFKICAQILSANPDIYTLWNYRKEVVLQQIDESENGKTEEASEGVQENLIKFLESELSLTEQCLLSNPKSYGSWHHRFWIMEHHPKPDWEKEFKLCTTYLSKDDRNFHVWDYRRLILKNIEFNLESELKFSTDRINVNFSNYSSWHYRSTILNLDAQSIREELRLVQSAVFTDPADSSAWFYLRWVLSNPAVTDEHRKSILNDFEQLLELEPDCKWIYMAKCWIKGSLSLNETLHAKENTDTYHRLIDLDPYRKGQYQDYIKQAQC